jgi:hypothetical protein
MFWSDGKRQYIRLNHSTGYPADASLRYECLECGDIVNSLPKDSTHCSCRNLMIDVDFGRISFRNPKRVRLFRELW